MTEPKRTEIPSLKEQDCLNGILPNIGETPKIDFDIPLELAKKPQVIQASGFLKKLEDTPEVEFERPGELEPPPTWRELLRNLKADQRKRQRLNQAQSYARIRIPSEGYPVGIALTSDWHIGAEGAAYDDWEKDMKLIYDEPLAYMLPLSNTIDNFIFQAGMYHQLDHPDEQMHFIKSFASDFKKKFLAFVGSDCHEGWTAKKTSLDPTKLMFLENIEAGTPWLQDGGVLEVGFKESEIRYTIYATHKPRFHSSLNPTNVIHRIHDLIFPADIIAAAHHHVRQVLYMIKWQNTPAEKTILGFRTGSYKPDDSYSKREGFGSGQRGSPMAIIFPYEKKMIGFDDIQKGVDYLRQIRESNNMRIEVEKLKSEVEELKGGLL